MKKLIVMTLLLCMHELVKAQTFQFQMYFEDAVGNKDTLTIGYDANGTALIDSSFGEENIIGIPLDSIFEVRMSDEHTGFHTLQTKKQILPDSCSGWRFPMVTIGIHCKNWPVTASWDSTLFNDDCRIGSVFTSMFPGGWWDGYGEPSDLGRADLAKLNKVTFTSNYNSSLGHNAFYINSSNDTIPIFWMAFGDSSLLTLSVDDRTLELNAYPNPVADYLYIDMESDLIHEIHIVDLLGRSKRVDFNIGKIDMRNFQSGNYVLLVRYTDGTCLRKKIVKN